MPSRTVEVSQRIAAPAADVARLCGDFGGIAAWHPAFRHAHVEGTDPSEGDGVRRTLDMNGTPVIEALESLAAEGRGYTYRVVKHPLVDAGAVGTIEVRGEGEASELCWSMRFDPLGPLPTDSVVELVRGLCRMGLAAAKDTLERGASASPPGSAPQSAPHENAAHENGADETDVWADERTVLDE